MTQRIDFSNPESNKLGAFIRSAAARDLPLVERYRHKDDRGAVICGLGPSMQKPSVLRQLRNLSKRGYKFFGLKEASTYLREKNIPVTYSVNMDPQAKEIGRVPIYPDVTYCLASSCHPDLYDHVIDNGGKVEVFHSACGYKDLSFEGGFVIDLTPGDPPSGDQSAVFLGTFDMKTQEGYDFCPVAIAVMEEVPFYESLFGKGDTMCGGFTVGNRAAALAKYMGFREIYLAGLDFGWREGDDYYAAFCKASPMRDVFMNDKGAVDGKTWYSRPDLLASAVDIAHKIRSGELKVLGDSLALALSKKDDEYLKNVCKIS